MEDVEHARGVIASASLAGVQAVGVKNFDKSVTILKKHGYIPNDAVGLSADRAYAFIMENEYGKA